MLSAWAGSGSHGQLSRKTRGREVSFAIHRALAGQGALGVAGQYRRCCRRGQISSLHPRKYRANFNVLCGAVASGECHLCAVCVELDEMEFGLVDMNVLTAIVAIGVISRQFNIFYLLADL